MSPVVLYEKLAFDRDWKGKWNDAFTGPCGVSLQHFLAVFASKQWNMDTGMSRDVETGAINQTFWNMKKKTYFICGKGWRQPCGGVSPCSEGRITTFWLHEFLEEQYAERCHQAYLQFAIKHILMQLCSSSLIFFFSFLHIFFFSLFLCLPCSFKH